jgi:polyhydroxybutyrate depolymerase
MNRTKRALLTALWLGGCGSDGADAGSTMPQSCPEAQLAADGSDIKMTLQHGGVERSYIVHVPKNVDPSRPTPLVVNYHGLTSNPEQQIEFSGLNVLADEKGFIVAYPTGLSNSFNAGSCCGALASPPNEADDADFARALVADLSAKICVDVSRVYSTGMSNGGYMSEYNACENADLFAAVAPVSAMGFQQPRCEPSRPIPMIAFNGTADGLVNYDGATMSVKAWLERNGCTGAPARADHGDNSYCETWSDCAEGAEVVHCTLEGMGHCWPGTDSCPYGETNTEISANEMMWTFLSRFTLPQ